MTYFLVGGGNILPLYDNMPHYSVISPNNYHTFYLNDNIPHYNVDDRRNELMFAEAIGNNLNHVEYASQLQNTHHLFSFAYKKVYDTINMKIPEEYIIIDSGGYSINSLNLPLNIDDYINFLKKARYNYAFNFDIIGDPEATYKNQKYIENHGLEVIPVFHLGSPYKYLQKYIDEGYTYISLGNMVGKHNKIRIPFLNKCFTLGMEEGIKFHGLGLSHKYCADYPLYSIDNSNHIMVRRNGQMKIRGNNIKIPRVQGITREERKWNDAEPVLIQLLNNIREYEEIVKKNWLKYHQYFKGQISMDDVLG